jgi:rRNA processing protein Gar1
VIKYLTQAEVNKRAKYKIAEIGSVFAPIKKVYGTITTNPYGNKYNTADVSIMAYTQDFWFYWEQRAKRENVFFELYADKAI